MDQKQRSRRRTTRRRVLWAGGIVAALTVSILICLALWGWIGLVMIPVVIAPGALWFFFSSKLGQRRLFATSGGFRTVLERWSGLAAIGAGILAVAGALSDWLPEDMWRLSRVLNFSLLGLSLILLAVALPGLQTRQAGRIGRLGRAGFIVAMLGVFPLTVFFVLQAVAAAFPRAAFSVWWGSWSLDFPFFLLYGGFAATLVGIALFGIATARANVLPRGAALIFALGWPIGVASGVLYALYFLPESTDNPNYEVRRVFDAIGLSIFAIGLIGLGHGLLAHDRLKKNLSKRLPELSVTRSPRGRMPRTGFADKTVWDWLQLLIVPIVLAVASFWFTLQQDIRQQATEERRAQETALDAYLDKIGELMLKEDAPLGESEEGDDVNTLARSRTLTVLSRLDGDHKARVVQFLYESRLIANDRPVLDLHGADLRDAHLNNADLSGADLSGVELASANLNNAELSGANLSESDLSDPDQEADLSGANLGGANLSGADLDNVPLTNAYLRDAYLRDATLEAADLSNADLGDADLSGAWLGSSVLSGANVVDADLTNADLTEADLSDADLSDVDLSGANLTDADLSYADLSNVQGVSEGRLVADLTAGYIRSLEGATMPDGQQHEVVATEFEPALSYYFSEGWQVSTETTDELVLILPKEDQSTEAGQLVFTSPSRVFDPSSPSAPTEVSAPEDVDEWASWFQKHPNLDTSEPVSLSVGGVSGLRIDATTSSTPETFSRDICGDQSCVPLYPLGIYSQKGWKDRFIIVDVEGEMVVINVGAPADDFDEFLPRAHKVLETVEWKSQ